eukprot:241116_1
MAYFDCRSWSDFHAEDEKLWIGGLQYFRFKTIRNMQPTPKQNYGLYVQALTMFHYMIEAWPWKGSPLKNKYCKALKLMITEEISENILKEIPSKTPKYILKLWHHFLSKIKKVEIDWGYLNNEVAMEPSKNSKYTRKNYGYKAFASLLCGSKSLKFSTLLKILPNVERIDLEDYYAETPILLNEYFISEILASISYINNTASLRSSFKSFNIFNPISNITDFININNNKFIIKRIDVSLDKKALKEGIKKFYKNKKNCNTAIMLISCSPNDKNKIIILAEIPKSMINTNIHCGKWIQCLLPLIDGPDNWRGVKNDTKTEVQGKSMSSVSKVIETATQYMNDNLK